MRSTHGHDAPRHVLIGEELDGAVGHDAQAVGACGRCCAAQRRATRQQGPASRQRALATRRCPSSCPAAPLSAPCTAAPVARPRGTAAGASGCGGAAAAKASHCARAVSVSRRGMRRPAAAKSTAGVPPKPRMPGGSTTAKPSASCRKRASQYEHAMAKRSTVTRTHQERRINAAPQRARRLRLAGTERRRRNGGPVAATRLRRLRRKRVTPPQRVLPLRRPAPPPLVRARRRAREERHARCEHAARARQRCARRRTRGDGCGAAPRFNSACSPLPHSSATSAICSRWSAHSQ